MGNDGINGKDETIILRNDLKEYMRAAGDLTAEEDGELREWAASGNCVYDNPYGLYEESGWPMDYIRAIRAWPALRDEFMLGTSESGSDDGLPF